MRAGSLRSGLWSVFLFLAGALPLAAELTVSGSVLGSPEQPFAGARVEVLPVLGNFESGRSRLAGEPDPAPVATGQSDAAGRYLLRVPAPGVFRIVVRGPGRVARQHAPLFLTGEEELPPVVLPLDAGARLRVVEASGRPLAGVWVFATGSEEKEASGRITEAWRTDFRIGRTGADGSLTLPRRAGELLDVSVFPPGRPEETRPGVEGGTISLPARSVAARTLQVVGAQSKPLEGILVRAGDLAWPVGLTNVEGRLQIPVKPGEAGKLRLVAPDGRQQVVDVPTSAPGDPDLVVALAAAATVTGRVLAGTGSRPLAGVLVAASADPGGFLITNEAGRYRLTAPDPEGFQLQVVAPGHLPRAVGVTGAHVRSGRAPALALTPAVPVRGQVVDAGGTPLAGVTLTSVPEPGPGLPEAVTDRASSDAAGRFELRRLRAGRGYELQALRPGYLPSAAQVVAPELPPREPPPLKIVLTKARAARGRVQDASGRPVVGADVSFPAFQDRTGRLQEGLRTDANGQFSIAQIPANPLDLTVRKRGWATAVVRGLRVPPGAGAADLGVIVLHPGARLNGRVTDQGGRPVVGAEIFQVDDLKRIHDKSVRLENDAAGAVTGPDGRFVLEDLPAHSPTHLLVRARGYLPAGIRGARAPNRDPVAVRLEAATSLRGRVLDEERQPVAGAWVELLVASGRPVTRRTVSGQDGRFEILDAPRGSGTIGVQAQGFVPIEDLEVVLPRPEPSGELIFTLEKGAVLTGRVSLTDGTPIPGVRVSAAGATAVSDDEGAYVAEGVAPGPALVGAFHPSYKRFFKEMVIEPGTNQLDMTFEPGLEVAGRVVDAEGAPVPGAWVHLGAEVRGERQYRARTATDGTFRLSPVARGNYRLRAGHEDYSPTELKRTVQVADEPVGGLEIALSQGGAIAGRVLGLKPEELARVTIEAASTGKTWPTTLDSEGRYEIRHLDPGDYLIRASLGEGQRQVQARVSLEPGRGDVVRDLEFSRRLSLSGQVLHGDEPLPEAVLTLRGNRFAVERSVVTDHQGGFRFEDLDPDLYALGLNHSGEHLVHNENVELSEDREIVLRLRTSTVSGLVTDARNGTPLPGTLILLRHMADAERPEFLVSGGTGEDGKFLLARVPPGNYRLTASVQGHASREQDVSVPAGQDVAELDIALEPTRGLDLTVRLASGKVPGMIHVRVLGAGGGTVVNETIVPDRSGSVRLATVPEGEWNLFLSAPGGAVVGSPITVPGEPRAVTLPEAGRLRVRVPALASSDLIATLTLRGGDQQPFWTLGPGGDIQERWTLVGGDAIVDGLPAGLWQVRVEAPDGQIWTGSVATSGHSNDGIILEGGTAAR